MKEQIPEAGITLSLIGGVLITFSALIFFFMFSLMSFKFAGMGFLIFRYPILIFPSIGLIAGMMIIALTFYVRERPATSSPIGATIVGLSLIGLFGGGGFLIGSLLSLIGGVLMIIQK